MSSKIEWTDETWNPLIGCTKVSAGCENCYAERMAGRLEAMGQVNYHKVSECIGLAREGKSDFRPRWNGRTTLVESALEKPLRWRKARKIFVCSMGDLFHESVPFEWIDQVFAVMAMCPQHTFQVLTKRPERMLEYLTKHLGINPSDKLADGAYAAFRSDQAACRVANAVNDCLGEGFNVGWPMRNLWLGTSVEDMVAALERIPALLKCPAALRFVSVEPMLGPVDLAEIDTNKTWPWKGETSKLDALRGHYSSVRENVNSPEKRRKVHRFIDMMSPRLDWVICGGESGPGARPVKVEWVRGLRDQCSRANTPFMFKQWGPNNKAGRVLDGDECLAFPGACNPEEIWTDPRNPQAGASELAGAGQ